MKYALIVLVVLMTCLLLSAFIMASAANFNQSQASIEQSKTTQQAQAGWMDAQHLNTVLTVVLIAALLALGFLAWKIRGLQMQLKLLESGPVDVRGYLRQGQNGPVQVNPYTRQLPAGAQPAQPTLQDLVSLKMLELLGNNSPAARPSAQIQPQEQPVDEWWRQA